MEKRDVALLYWTAASWGAAISVSKDDPALVSDQLVVEALIDRALELDETFDRGGIHSLLISYEMVRAVKSGANLMNGVGYAPCLANGTTRLRDFDKWDGCATKNYFGIAMAFTGMRHFKHQATW